jgi:hypothetical protein
MNINLSLTDKKWFQTGAIAVKSVYRLRFETAGKSEFSRYFVELYYPAINAGTPAKLLNLEIPKILILENPLAIPCKLRVYPSISSFPVTLKITEV